MPQKTLTDLITGGRPVNKTTTSEWTPPDFAKPESDTWEPPEFAIPEETEEASEGQSFLDRLFTPPKFVSDYMNAKKEKYESYANKINSDPAFNEAVMAGMIPDYQPQPSSGGIDVIRDMITPGDIAMMVGTGGGGIIPKAGRAIAKTASAALAARGAERLYNAKDTGDRVQGAIETVGGALGYKFPVTWGDDVAEEAARVAARQAKLDEIAAKNAKSVPDIEPETPLDKIAKEYQRINAEAKELVDKYKLTPAQARAAVKERNKKFPQAAPEEAPKVVTPEVVTPEAPVNIAGLLPEGRGDDLFIAGPEGGQTLKASPYTYISDEMAARLSGENINPLQNIDDLRPEVPVKNPPDIPFNTREGEVYDQYGNLVNTREASAEAKAAGTSANPLDELVEAVKAPQAPPVVTLTMKAYGAGLKDGSIPKGTKFADWVKGVKAAQAAQAPPVNASVTPTAAPVVAAPKKAIDPFANKKKNSSDAIIEFLKSEEGSFDPLDPFSRKGKKAIEDKKLAGLQQEIVDTLIAGRRLNLPDFAAKAKTLGISTKKFNALVDEIIDTGATAKAAAARNIVSRTNPNPQDVATATKKIFDAITVNKGLREAQEDIYREGRKQRLKDFMAVKTPGFRGAKEAMSKLKGEFDSVNGEALQLTDKDLDTVFSAIRNSPALTGYEIPTAMRAMGKLLQGGRPLQRKEIAILDDVFGSGFTDQIIELHGGLGAVGINIAKTAATMRSMMSSIDVSAPLRQGITMAGRKEFYTSLVEMFRYLGSQTHFNKAMQTIIDRPNFELGKDAGLYLANIGSLSKGEEAYLYSYLHDLSVMGKEGSTARKIGQGSTALFRASERAYVGFLNKLRSDVFDSMIHQATMLGHDPEKVAPGIARFVNNMTGRGSLGKLEDAAPILNTVFFSPRLIASRMQMLNPKIYTDLPKGMRHEGLKSLLALGAAGLTVNAIGGQVFGGKMSTNPLSPDFLKQRFGENTLDPWGGFQQYAVLAARFLAGRKHTNATGYTAPTRVSIVGDFLANKLSPMAALAYDLGTMKPNAQGELINRYGEKADVPYSIYSKFMPMVVQDLTELIQSDADVAKILGIGVPTALGMGTQTYPDPEEESIRRSRGFRRF